MIHWEQRQGWIKPLFITLAVSLLVIGLAAAGFASEGAEGAHHPDSAAVLKDFGWRMLNFALLAAIVIWGMKKANLKGLLSDRQAAIEKTLRDATAAREAAEKKFAECSEKLSQGNREVDEIYAAIKKEGELEKERIIAEAKVSAEKIKEQARLSAEREIFKAKSELRAEAGRLAVQLAEEMLRERVGKDDQNRLVGEYLTKVVERH